MHTPPFMSFATSDVDTFAEGLAPIVPGMNILPLRGGRIHAQLTATRLPDLGLFTTRFRNIHITSFDPRPFIGATIPLQGVCRFVSGQRAFDALPGRIHVADAERPFDARMTDDACEFLAVIVDNDKLASLVSQFDGEPSRKARIRECLSPDHPTARQLAHRACEFWRDLRHGKLPESEIAVREASDRLICTLLEAGTKKAPDRLVGTAGDGAAATAAEYIVENLDGALTLSDIARNAGTSRRTLTRAFRRRFGTSPQRFVRDRRLEAVSRSLLVAEPGETTVTDAAMRFGFWHLGRFSAQYRKGFGESPSSTLRRHRS